jgi:ABC-type branched-subunit amino acid transport system permease subunit
MRSLLFCLLAAGLVLGLASAFPWLKIPLILSLCYGLAALGIVVLLKAGQISFGHAMYACISGYVVAFVGHRYPGLDGLLLIALGTLASVVAGMLIGAFVVRYREIFFGMLNLAISMVLFTLLGKFYSYTGGTDGLRINRPSLLGQDLGRDPFEIALLVLVLVISLVAVFGVQRYFLSSGGQALAAIKTNETRLEYLGKENPLEGLCAVSLAVRAFRRAVRPVARPGHAGNGLLAALGGICVHRHPGWRRACGGGLRRRSTL